MGAWQANGKRIGLLGYTPFESLSMPLFHLIILALVQGITEFLPISSSGHLVLAHAALGHAEQMSEQQEKILDIAVHVGTLFAVCLYFRADLWRLILGGIDILRFRQTDNRRLALFALYASIPVIAAGFALHSFDAAIFDSLVVIGWTTLIFGVALWVADHYRPNERSIDTMGTKDAVLIGLSQIIALIPGTSRSGITMTMARWLGFSRTEAARFSLLLSIIAIAGAGTLAGLDVISIGSAAFTRDLFIGAALAAVSAFITIALMMNWLLKASFTPFAVYRVILGAVLLGLYYGGFLA